MLRPRHIFIFLISTLFAKVAEAQCAMCKTQIVNNVSSGDTNLAAGLNFGILYLFVTPYLLIGIVAFLWFRYSKINERKIGISRRLKGKMS